MSTVAARPQWIGIDLGTQSIRVLAADENGRVTAAGSAPLHGKRDGVRHEQDPEEWWSAVGAASRQALASVDTSGVRAVAVDATSGTILLADDQLRPRTPALMYDDARAQTEAVTVNDAGGHVWAELGYARMQPSWALPKLLWLLRHRPDLGAEPRIRMLHQADLITGRLAGATVPSDASHALKSGYHLIEERWPTDLLDSLSVPVGILPDVVRPGTTLGMVCDEAAAHTLLPAGTPVVAGMTDGCAAQLAAGALAVGSWNSVLGTTLVLKGVSDHIIRDPHGVVYCHRGTDGTWLPGGASSAGAQIVSQRFRGADLDHLTAQAARLPYGPIAYPIVTPGERFPFLAPSMEPFVLGDVADDAEMFAAVMLGLACVERLCFDMLAELAAPVDGHVCFTGGGTRNRYWCQLRADLLDRQVILPEHAEPALGMAVLAATTDGTSIRQAADRMVRPDTQLSPRRREQPALFDRYGTFVDQIAERGWLSPEVADVAHRRIPR
ncbi:MAG: FGGY-family carbohydrate kinase [Marmoricola sp.]